MKKRTFMLRPPYQMVDYRDDEMLLGALESEIKLASRFFNIVDFISENLVDEAGNVNKEDIQSRETMAERGRLHWEKAKKIISLRKEMDVEYGSLDTHVETYEPAPRNSRKDS